MAQRPDQLLLTLGTADADLAQDRREGLTALATAVGFKSTSELVRFLADAYMSNPEATRLAIIDLRAEVE